MKVRKADNPAAPRYPTRRQFADGAKALGLVALGVGGAWVAGCEPKRTGGVLAPVRSGSPAIEEPTRLRGDVAVDPKTNALPHLDGLLRVDPPKK